MIKILSIIMLGLLSFVILELNKNTLPGWILNTAALLLCFCLLPRLYRTGGFFRFFYEVLREKEADGKESAETKDRNRKHLLH